MSILHFGLCLVLCQSGSEDAGAVSEAATTQQPPAEVEFRRRLRESVGKLKSLRVEYHLEERTGQEPGVRFRRCSLAIRAPFDASFSRAVEYDSVGWRDDPFRLRVDLSKDKISWTEILNRAYRERSLSESDVVPSAIGFNHFLAWTGLWPLQRRSAVAVAAGPYLLEDVARSEHYKLLPERVTLDGHVCSVLARAADKLWIDSARGNCLLRRETLVDDSAGLVHSLHLSEHREVAEGIWLPMLIDSREHQLRKGQDAETTQLFSHMVLTVQTIRVNKPLRESEFARALAPGTVCVDEKKGETTQCVPGGGDHLEQMATAMKIMVPLSEMAGRRPLRLYLLLIVAIVALGEVGVRGWRMIGTKAAASSTSDDRLAENLQNANR